MATAAQMHNAAARRAGLVQLIHEHIENRGYPPTLTEMADATGVHRETIKKDMSILREEGVIVFDDAPAGRAIRLVGYRVALVPIGQG